MIHSFYTPQIISHYSQIFYIPDGNRRSPKTSKRLLLLVQQCRHTKPQDCRDLRLSGTQRLSTGLQLNLMDTCLSKSALHTSIFHTQHAQNQNLWYFCNLNMNLCNNNNKVFCSSNTAWQSNGSKMEGSHTLLGLHLNKIFKSLQKATKYNEV